jgi:hypothetical protein
MRHIHLIILFEGYLFEPDAGLITGRADAGIPSSCSIRMIVLQLMPDFSDNSCADHPRAARAARICNPSIIDSPFFVI